MGYGNPIWGQECLRLPVVRNTRTKRMKWVYWGRDGREDQGRWCDSTYFMILLSFFCRSTALVHLFLFFSFSWLHGLLGVSASPFLLFCHPFLFLIFFCLLVSFPLFPLAIVPLASLLTDTMTRVGMRTLSLHTRKDTTFEQGVNVNDNVHVNYPA